MSEETDTADADMDGPQGDNEEAPVPTPSKIVVALRKAYRDLKDCELEGSQAARVKLRHALEALGYPPTVQITTTEPEKD